MPSITGFRKFALSAIALVGLTAGARSQLLEVQPEPGTTWGWAPAAAVTAKTHMISAANPVAVEAGLQMLRAGGSAADAAIAVQLVLNLVEPQSSGLGGGAFVLHWDAAGKTLKSYDGRETAPAAAKPDRFLVNNRPMNFGDAIFGGASVGVPGTLRLLESLHRAHGRLPWAQLFGPAIRLAEEGFRVSTRLHWLLRWYGADSFAPRPRRYFFDQTGSARPAGYLLRNPEFAATLRAIAERGAGAFYEGPIAQAIVEAVATAPNHQGDVTLADLAGYKAKERDPLCFAYRKNRICSMGPPSSGGIAVAQALKLVEAFDLGQGPADALNTRSMHLIAEAEKLAFADRDHYIGDPDFVRVPIGLLDSGYLAARRSLIDPQTAMGRPSPGTPPQLSGLTPGADETLEMEGTSHISIVDGIGNVAVHDDHHRGRLRLAPVGRGLPAQQRDDRFRLPPAGQRRPAAGQRDRARQAAAQFDGADHRFRRGGQAVGGAGIARRVAHHPLRGEDAGGADRLENGRAAGGLAHELRQPRRRVRDRD